MTDSKEAPNNISIIAKITRNNDNLLFDSSYIEISNNLIVNQDIILNKLNVNDKFFYKNKEYFNNNIEISNGHFDSINVLNYLYADTYPLYSSDGQYKITQTNISNGLEIINRLVPKKYIKTKFLYDASYNGELLDGDVGKIECGVIAQEILDISDLKHSVNIHNNIYNLKYNDIFIYNMAAIKELNKIVNEQNIIINYNNKRLDDLLNKNNELNNENELLVKNVNNLLIELNKTTL